MTQEEINQAIYNKYILPTKTKKEVFIGIEIEMPIINLDKEAVDERVVFSLSEAFCSQFSFDVISCDAYGNANSMQNSVTGDDLSFDCAYSNLELSLGKGENLHEIKSRFDKYYAFINNFLADYNYTLTGMGINPYYRINHNEPIQNERYRMLYHHLHSYTKYPEVAIPFHSYPKFGTFTSATQVQIDIFHDDLIPVINTFNKLEPFKSILFANSYFPDEPDLTCARNMLWERSMQGYNPHNIGMFKYELKDIDDLVEYIKTTSIYCIMRNGKYVNFTPIPINDYLKLNTVHGEYFDGKKYVDTDIVPSIKDLEYLRTFKFEDLTYRGTIEFRSSCTQPIYDSMCVAAFHIGLLKRVDELSDLLGNDRSLYSHGYSAAELQRILSRKKLPDFIDLKMLSSMLIQILELAESGLKQRGMNEEKFLTDLYKRAETLSNPAIDMINGLKNGKAIEYYIKKYSENGESDG